MIERHNLSHHWQSCRIGIIFSNIDDIGRSTRIDRSNQLPSIAAIGLSPTSLEDFARLIHHRDAVDTIWIIAACTGRGPCANRRVEEVHLVGWAGVEYPPIRHGE